MKLYYKQWDQFPIEIPEDAIILGDADVKALQTDGGYPYFFCWELGIINKIIWNQEGYFDFTKSMIDIGACLGEYCWLIPFQHSYAFEPNKDAFCRLCANLVLRHKTQDCDVFQELCSDRVQEIEFDGWAGDLSMDHTKAKLTKATTIDSYNFENIGFIKVDVEGMEEKVLRGAVGTIIRNNYPPILFELWDVGQQGNYVVENGMTQEKHDSLVNFLEGLGYEILPYWGDFETHLAIHKKQK